MKKVDGVIFSATATSQAVNTTLTSLKEMPFPAALLYITKTTYSDEGT
jgi:hypothetical protein